MAKRRLFIAAVITLTIVLSLALAACGPSSYAAMSSVQQKYYEKYGSNYTALGPDGLVLYQDNDTKLFGYLDATSGEVVIEAKYTNAEKFTEGMALVTSGSGNVSVIDKSGKTLLTGLDGGLPVWDKIFGVKDGKYGVWNNKGEAIIPAEYDGIKPTYGSFLVLRGNKIALADGKGKMLTDFIYDDVLDDVGDYILMIREDGGVDFVNMTDGKVADTRYDDVDLMYIGFDRYMVMNYKTYMDGPVENPVEKKIYTSFSITDENLKELRCLPDGLYPVDEDIKALSGPQDRYITEVTEMVDKNTYYISANGTQGYFLDIKSGDLTPATATQIGDMIAYKNGDNWDVYGNGEVAASVPDAELGYCHIVSGTFRDYMFNTATNTLTDLLTGESVKLSREVKDVTGAEEGMFVVQNKDGKYAACAKNGTLLTEFCFDEMTAYSDGFVGYRGNVCEWYGTEGNLILRSNDKSIG